MTEHVSTDVHYHDQPHTLDPAKEIGDDAPLAQGHDSDDAADVQAAQADHSDQVEAEAKAEAKDGPVGPRAAGDHAGQDKKKSDGNGDDDCPPNGTVDEILDWAGDDHERAQKALRAERDGQNRSTLVSKLEAI